MIESDEAVLSGNMQIDLAHWYIIELIFPGIDPISKLPVDTI